MYAGTKLHCMRTEANRRATHGHVSLSLSSAVHYRAFVIVKNVIRQVMSANIKQKSLVV